METKSHYFINHEINPMAPVVPDGKSIGKDSMTFALSNDVLKALPLNTVSFGAQELFHYLAAHAADEIKKAVEDGTFDYSDTQVKRFAINMKEYISFLLSVGKKHYTMNELDKQCGELLKLPVEFMGDDETINAHAVPFPYISLNKETGECEYVITNEFLKHWAPELSAHGEEKKEQHLLSLMESFKFNGYQNRLYRLINGHMQTMSSEYIVGIRVLKMRMGVTEEESAWENKRFIARILTPSCNAVNEKSDIRFSYRIQKHEKSNRIKNIIFYEFRRFGKNSYYDTSPVIDGEFREVLEDKKATDTTSIKLNEGERQLAIFIHLSSSKGLSIDEACDMYELYRGDVDKYKKKIELYENMLKAGFVTEESKMLFFSNMDIV